jgi:hypothetical protein
VAELKTGEGFDFARLSGGTFPLFLPPAPMLPRTAVERVLYGATDEIGSLSRRHRLFDPIPVGQRHRQHHFMLIEQRSAAFCH